MGLVFRMLDEDPTVRLNGVNIGAICDLGSSGLERARDFGIWGYPEP